MKNFKFTLFSLFCMVMLVSIQSADAQWNYANGNTETVTAPTVTKARINTTYNGAGLNVKAPSAYGTCIALIPSSPSGWNSRINFYTTDGGGERHWIFDNFDSNMLTFAPGAGSGNNTLDIWGKTIIRANYQTPQTPAGTRLSVMEGIFTEKVVVSSNNTTLAMPGGYRLYVEDGILTEKVKVAIKNAGAWADYVFDDTYDRNSIDFVSNFIRNNKHLPNVPSATEVEKNGMDLAEMDATLLRQIEELWLHVIDLKKENEALKATIEKGTQK